MIEDGRFRVRVKERIRWTVFSLEGSLDSYSWKTLEETIDNMPKKPKGSIVRCGGLQELSLSGVGLLLGMVEIIQKHCSVILVELDPSLREHLRTLMVESSFLIFPTVRDAKRYLRANK